MVEYCPMRIHHLSFQCSSSGSLDIYLKKLISHGKVINPRGLTIFYRIYLVGVFIKLQKKLYIYSIKIIQEFYLDRHYFFKKLKFSIAFEILLEILFKFYRYSKRYI